MIIPRDQVNVIIKNGATQGLSKEAVLDSMIRNGMEPEGLDISSWKSPQPKKEESRFVDTAKDLAGAFTDTAETSQTRADNIQKSIEAGKNGEQTGAETALQVIGQGAGAGADAIGNLTKAIGKAILNPKDEEEVKKVITKFGTAVAEDPHVQELVRVYSDLPENKKRDIDAAGGLVSLASEFLGAGGATAAKKVVTEGADTVIDAGKRVLKTATDAIPTGSTVTTTGGEAASGITQTIKDLINRVPRAAERVQDATATAAARAKRISESTPEVAKAIEVNLPDDLIEATGLADDATKKAFNEVLDVAESPRTLKGKQQPTIVGGKLAAEQYDVINKQKKEVGRQLGEKVKELSKDTTVDIHPAIQKMDEVLAHNGIKASIGDEGKVIFDFSSSNLSTAERSRIKELYDLVTESGGEVTPEVIYKKNQLFSKLQREAKFEGLGDIIIETPDGSKQSIFQTFRDIYSGTLDEVSPEIKALNKQYGEYARLTDDIEDSILKTPNFNATKNADPAEFAKVNLRRIFGEAQSSPAFEAVADAMDAASRGLGYKGATPKQVAEFAQRVRELYPDSIPSTGFTGSVKLGVKDVVEGVMNAGAPNATDQQRALRELLKTLPYKK